MQRPGFSTFYTLIALAALAAGIAGWYVLSDPAAPPGTAPQSATVVVAPPSKGEAREPSRPEPPGEAVPEIAAPAVGPARVVVPGPAAPAPPVRAVTAQEIESEYAKATDTESRAEVARNLASLDTIESVGILARLFATSRAYSDKVAIVGSLSEAQSDNTLDAKLTLLRSALAPGQVRQVRSAALDVAAQMDDPRAKDILRQTAKNDPDPQVRELAKAVLAAQ